MKIVLVRNCSYFHTCMSLLLIVGKYLNKKNYEKF